NQVNAQAIEQIGTLDGVLAAYVRYDPNLTYGTSGLFYTDSDGDGKKDAGTPTDLLAYERDDKEHVGWFYEPLDLGRASWMEPYYNSNLDKTIISYVAPFYIDEKDFGVVGIDFDFDYITKINEKNDVYKTGYTFIMGKDYNFINHPQYTNNEKFAEIENGAYKEIVQQMQKDKNGFIKEKVNGKLIIMGYAVMNNGWIVGISPTEEEIYQNRDTTLKLLLTAALFLVLISALVAYLMGTWMTRSIRKLVTNIESISKGDFSVEINAKGRDEISDISRKLGTFIDKMKEIILELSKTSTKLGSEAEESGNISNTMYDLIEGQMDSTKKIKYAAENLVQSTEDIANNATALAHSVSEVNTQGGTAKSKMNDTVIMTEKGKTNIVKVQETMGNIDIMINDLEGVVMEVGGSANEINDIIKIIGDIASQTNLLSLNASIEAARAGEAGKGFAVVASEIGNLANMCTNAAKQIAELITKVNLQIGDTIKKTQNAVGDIKENKELVEDTYGAFMDIYGCVKEAAVLLNGVTESIRKVDDVAASMAAITEEQSASTEEMLSISEELYEYSGKTEGAGLGVKNMAQELENTAENVREVSQFFHI
ncbi:MAG: methyl-accepting chemotaxis protein, partial [Acetivibrio sp.]